MIGQRRQFLDKLNQRDHQYGSNGAEREDIQIADHRGLAHDFRLDNRHPPVPDPGNQVPPVDHKILL